MFKKTSFKLYDHIPLPVFILDKSKKLIYHNAQCAKFVKMMMPDGKLTNSILWTAMGANTQFIFKGHEFRVGDAGKYYVVIVRDISYLDEKLHGIRHNIKNAVNPLAMMTSLGVDTEGMVRVVNESVESLKPKNFLF